MANNKNQHFVPRCHLDKFASDAEGNSICLLNINSGKIIENAPIKGQCSKNYFYGKDLGIEKALQSFEGMYSKCVRRIMKNDFSIDDIYALNKFAYLQFHRTEAAAKRSVASMIGLADHIDPAGNQIPRDQIHSLAEATGEALQMLSNTEVLLDDLKTIFVVNKTNIDFITSDDPAIMVNRYYAQRLYRQNSGVTSSGLMLCIPLTPRLYMVMYDSLVYRVDDKVGHFVEITKLSDTKALNELQAIKASGNIYFASSNQSKHVLEALANAHRLRRDQWFEVESLILVEELADRKIYRPGTQEEAIQAEHSIVRVGYKNPIPDNWFSKIKIRNKPKFYNADDSIVHVRHPEWLSERSREAFVMRKRVERFTKTSYGSTN